MTETGSGGVSYCRICEPVCGMVATVDEGRLTTLVPDKANPHSQGFACAKGPAMVDVVNDPDRVTVPLRRVGGPGEFAPTTWDQALGDIAQRLGHLRREHGGHSIALSLGNPLYFSYAAPFWVKGFQRALGTPWMYAINSEDAGARLVATHLLYGSMAYVPIPDYTRTDVLVVIGANPWVSKGGLVDDPLFRQHFKAIPERGGRVIVIDPRRTETARRFEHIPIQPGTDPWMLLGVLHTLFDEGLCDDEFIAASVRGADTLREWAARFPPEQTAEITGVPSTIVRDLARTIGTASAAVVYGRTGTCTQRFGTLANVLQDAINVVTGNLQRPGGWVFGWSPIATGDFAERLGVITYDSVRTRVSGLPDVYGMLPYGALTDDIRVPGEGQVRALVAVGSNPALTGPRGDELTSALAELDTFVSLDLYVNETNKHADYVLPCTTMYEREDFPLLILDRFIRPSLQVTEPVVEPRGESRQEWEILDELCRRMGLGGPYHFAIARKLARLGIRMKPRQMADLLIRTSAVGDWFGLRRRGWSWRKLVERAPHGVVLHEQIPIEPLNKRLKHPDQRVHLDDERIVAELGRLATSPPVRDTDFPILLVQLREVLSHNSWLHNAERLMPPHRRPTLRMHPDDASDLGVLDGADAVVTSNSGTITVRTSVTDEIGPGVVALPHGWGHAGGWQRANAAGGSNSNLLPSRSPEDLERLASMTVLNGIPVRIAPAIADR